MPGPKPYCVTLREQKRELLEPLMRRQTRSPRLIRRAKTVLAAAEGASNESSAVRLSLNRNTGRTGRHRWWSGADALAAAEAAGDAAKA